MRLMQILNVCTFLIICAFLISSDIQSQERQDVLRAGIAKIDITPEKPVKMSGYRARKDLSEGIHDPLYARAVVFENSGNRLVLVSSDLIGYYGGTFKYMQENITEEFNLKPDELFLSGIHTHAGPTLTVEKENGHPNNLEYTEKLKEKLITIIRNAINNMTTVHTGVGIGYSPIGSNRREMQRDGSIKLGRNPYGPTNKEVLVMKIVRPDGFPVGALFDYATHATSLGGKNLLISGDVLGLAGQFVEKILSRGVISPIFAGASGNIDPWYRVLPAFNNEPGWIPEPVLLGTLLGEEVVTVFRNITKVVPGGQIKTSFTTINCPRKKSDEAAEQESGDVPVNITAARVREVAFIGISVEMLTEVGMAIKAGSPYKHTFLITHCNGARGYLPPDYLYKEGGYEIGSTPFAPQAADMIVKKALRMIYEL